MTDTYIKKDIVGGADSVAVIDIGSTQSDMQRAGTEKNS